jgi:hypothetical protein
MIAGYLGKSDTFDRAIETFSALYADQTKSDYEMFPGAIESGEINAEKEKNRFFSCSMKDEGYLWGSYSFISIDYG